MSKSIANERSITAADTLIRNDGELLTTVVDGELIGMSVERGACYGLNGVGTRIWDLLEQPRSIDSLCEELVREFDVEPEVCLREVLELAEELRAEGLVTVSAG